MQVMLRIFFDKVVHRGMKQSKAFLHSKHFKSGKRFAGNKIVHMKKKSLVNAKYAYNNPIT